MVYGEVTGVLLEQYLAWLDTCLREEAVEEN